MRRQLIATTVLVFGFLSGMLQAQSMSEVQKLTGVRAIDIYIARLSESGKAKETAQIFVKALSDQPDNLDRLYGAMRAVLEADVTGGMHNIFTMSKIGIIYKNSEINFNQKYISESERNEWERVIKKSLDLLETKYEKHLMFVLSKIFFIRVFGDPRLRFWEEEIPTNPKGVRTRSNYEEIVKPYWEQVEKLQPENVYLLYEKTANPNIREKERHEIFKKIFKNIDQLDIYARRLVLHALAEQDERFDAQLKKLLVSNPTHPVNLFFVLNFHKYSSWFCQETGIKFIKL